MTIWFVGSQVYSPDGKKRYELKAYEDALGIKTMGTSHFQSLAHCPMHRGSREWQKSSR
jgi:hypothetical protein